MIDINPIFKFTSALVHKVGRRYDRRSGWFRRSALSRCRSMCRFSRGWLRSRSSRLFRWKIELNLGRRWLNFWPRLSTFNGLFSVDGAALTVVTSTKGDAEGVGCFDGTADPAGPQTELSCSLKRAVALLFVDALLSVDFAERFANRSRSPILLSDSGIISLDFPLSTALGVLSRSRQLSEDVCEILRSRMS
ncbi:unnamed protein product [Somion occarium]|uniref:Uncharacterized protein n=1 Tax=Somion occarium TaxID=3059160 RepID=A0ABP1E8B8_9APHY